MNIKNFKRGIVEYKHYVMPPIVILNIHKKSSRISFTGLRAVL